LSLLVKDLIKETKIHNITNIFL